MTREQAINYLICRGITEYQVSEIVRALTYKPRDCANCKHYVVTDTRTNWGSQETTKIYGCECWECEYEPTTKNNLGVDCISREATVKRLCNLAEYMNEHKENSGDPYIMAALFIQDNKTEFPSVTPQLSVPEVTALAEWTEKLTKASEDAYNKGYADGMKEQESFINKPCVSSGVCEHDKNKALDNIRTEIETKYGQCDICEYFEDYDYEENDISEYRPIGNIADILQIIDKYKAETEETDGTNKQA